MVVAAVIVASNSGISPLTKFGGLSLLKRAVLTAQKMGARTCLVTIPEASTVLRQEVENDPRVTIRILWGFAENPASETTEQESQWLVYPIDAIFRHPFVQRLLEKENAGQSFAVLDQEGQSAFLVATEQLTARLWPELVQGQSFLSICQFFGQEVVQKPAPQGHFLGRLKGVGDVKALEHALLRSLENAKDGMVDTLLNRKFSRPITRGLLRTPITPNQVTILAGVVCVLGAFCFSFGGYLGPLLGALCLQFSTVLDCCDGEIARIKFMEPPLGDTLDIVVDTVGSIAIFLGIGVAVWKNGGSEYALVLGGVLALGGILSFPLVTLAEKTEEAGKRRGGWEDALIHALLLGLTSRDYSLLILASALVGQLSWFLWGAAFGSHLFWIFLAWLLFRAGRFGLAWKTRKGTSQ